MCPTAGISTVTGKHHCRRSPIRHPLQSDAGIDADRLSNVSSPGFYCHMRMPPGSLYRVDGAFWSSSNRRSLRGSTFHATSEEAVEAGLVGCVRDRLMDAEDGLTLGDEKPGQVFGEVTALALVGEQVGEL